jgi:anthranilate phosphoribosyltransferase
MREYLQLVATGPELSKSLNEAQAEDGMSMILDRDIDAVRAGIFLIALRMKRESDAENAGILSALIGQLQTARTRSAEILSVADPFNGYLRGLPATPFLPAVFAACGLPAYSHGLQSVGPKYGITTRLVLEQAGKNVDMNVREAADLLDNPDAGWAYLDQKHYIESLHDLVELRDTMVKRTCLSTLEVVLKPLSGAKSTHLLTGFVHKAYPPVYAMLARQSGFDSAAIVRGVEGGCIPSLSQLSRYFGCRNDGTMELFKLVPGELGIEQDTRAVTVPDQYADDIEQTCYKNTRVLESVVAHTLELGLDALGNKPGPMQDSIIYGVSIGLTHTGLVSGLGKGAELARKVIASGEALAKFEAG